MSDDWGIRWTGTLTPRFSERYTVSIRAEDGVRLWVNGQLLVDRLNNDANTEYSGQVTLSAWQPVGIRIDFNKTGRNATAQLSWASASQPKQIIPAAQLALPPVGTGTGLRGEYYDNSDLTGLVTTRLDPTVNFGWSAAPAPGVGADTFAVRCTGGCPRLQPGRRAPVCGVAAGWSSAVPGGV